MYEETNIGRGEGTHLYGSSASDDYLERSGERCVLVRELGSDEIDMDESGPMWEIRFADGQCINAFADELMPA